MNNTSSITQFQSDWFKFSDLDRAGAILAIKQTGIPTRMIADRLQLSESLLRHLLQALQASACDLDLAREGKITTNELVRRAKAIGVRQSLDNHEALESERVDATRKASDLICDWLFSIQLFGPGREMIVKEVQRTFRLMKEAYFHPSVATLPELSVSEIIERTKPPALTDDCIDIVGWFAQWLYRWSLCAFSDEAIRNAALDLALKTQLTRKASSVQMAELDNNWFRSIRAPGNYLFPGVRRVFCPLLAPKNMHFRHPIVASTST